MAGREGKTISDLDKEAIKKYNRVVEQSLKREQLMHRHNELRGNKLPPFSIEPMPYERQRLSGSGMTDADRALRKQWVMDQHLSPNEPRHIAELEPRNIFRRAYSAPLGWLFNKLRPSLGNHNAVMGRYYTSRILMGVAVVYLTWYHLKYNLNDWTRKGGWYIYGSRPVVLPGDAMWPAGEHKEISDFCDKGFKERSINKDLKTSAGDSN